jgi:chromosomal replication initiation ATPase DnaA
VESERGEEWGDFQNRHGDWGKGLVLYLARTRGGYTLRELGEWLGGIHYKTVSKQIERFESKLSEDRSLARLAKRCLRQMSNVET